jgi:curved DNA-binding protein CbpA
MEPSIGDHYEVLGIAPTASVEQVEQAYRFAADMYSEAALATYSLLEPREIGEMRARIERAYEVLRDPFRRREYDQGQGGESQTPLLPFPASPSTFQQPPPAPTPGPLHCAQDVLADPVTGGDLKRYRESKGIRLRDIAARSKVGVRYLEYIEADRYPDLPAAVYLRSFLQEYARAVGLEPRKTADSYMSRLPRNV